LEDFPRETVVSIHNKISNYLKNNKVEQPEMAKKLMNAFMQMGKVQDIPIHTPIRVWTDVYNSSREVAAMVVTMAKGEWESPIQNVLLAPKSNGSRSLLGSPAHPWETAFTNKKESWMQVAMRVELFFNAIRADHDNHRIEDFIIFASPEILNLFQIMWKRDSWQKVLSNSIEDYSVTVFHQDSKIELL
jgi:hypothetical protein